MDKQCGLFNAIYAWQYTQGSGSMFTVSYDSSYIHHVPEVLTIKVQFCR